MRSKRFSILAAQHNHLWKVIHTHRHWNPNPEAFNSVGLGQAPGFAKSSKDDWDTWPEFQPLNKDSVATGQQLPKRPPVWLNFSTLGVVVVVRNGHSQKGHYG